MGGEIGGERLRGDAALAIRRVDVGLLDHAEAHDPG